MLKGWVFNPMTTIFHTALYLWASQITYPYLFPDRFCKFLNYDIQFIWRHNNIHFAFTSCAMNKKCCKNGWEFSGFYFECFCIEGSNQFSFLTICCNFPLILTQKGNPVAGAKVKLQDRSEVITKSDGTYELEKIKSGTYVLSASKEHIFFEGQTMKINPNTPRLPDIIASR